MIEQAGFELASAHYGKARAHANYICVKHVI
jgi:hypothetical protein